MGAARRRPGARSLCRGPSRAGARHGAMLQFDEPVTRWQSKAGHVSVVTKLGEYRARQIGDQRRRLGQFTAARDDGCHSASSARCCTGSNPLAKWTRSLPSAVRFTLWQFDGDRFFYGFPDKGAGVKVAFHHGGQSTTVEELRREVTVADVEEVRAAVRRFVPPADGPIRRSVVCMYTNTPDEHFWIDATSRIAGCPGRQRVLGTWLQVRSGNRRNPRRSRRGEPATFRPQPVPLALRSAGRQNRCREDTLHHLDYLDAAPSASVKPGTKAAPVGTWMLDPWKSLPTGSNLPPRH